MNKEDTLIIDSCGTATVKSELRKNIFDAFYMIRDLEWALVQYLLDRSLLLMLKSTRYDVSMLEEELRSLP